ncbi:hypothetical protein [Bdellovibrio sp. GT3]|uniref:hypothetical protein n=1 Tax=unclassified Bdellovibrio TaxID=2633795 RepID=UPI0030EFB399
MKFVKVTRGYEVIHLNVDHIHFMSEAEKNTDEGRAWVTTIRFSLEPHDKIEVKERIEDILKQLS